ncbi:hypothetical protein CF327_g4072 [Tilletia walkeri]|nr:hypothetical protein CF327_g4072 [Tilletia walkeri]
MPSPAYGCTGPRLRHRIFGSPGTSSTVTHFCALSVRRAASRKPAPRLPFFYSGGSFLAHLEVVLLVRSTALAYLNVVLLIRRTATRLSVTSSPFGWTFLLAYLNAVFLIRRTATSLSVPSFLFGWTFLSYGSVFVAVVFLVATASEAIGGSVA